MAIKRITPVEAKRLLDEGWIYLDVRSVPEYEEGHPAGAHNAPLLHHGSYGMSANHEFLPVVERAYPRDAKIVVGCRSGVRSQRAAMMMEMAGFSNVVEMKGGFAGEHDVTGRIAVPGWLAEGLPVSTEPPPGGTWEELRRK